MLLLHFFNDKSNLWAAVDPGFTLILLPAFRLKVLTQIKLMDCKWRHRLPYVHFWFLLYQFCNLPSLLTSFELEKWKFFYVPWTQIMTKLSAINVIKVLGHNIYILILHNRLFFNNMMIFLLSGMKLWLTTFIDDSISTFNVKCVTCNSKSVWYSWDGWTRWREARVIFAVYSSQSGQSSICNLDLP